MSGFSFRPAVRANVPLLISLAGGTGSGKSLSALKIARGLAGGEPFAFIDTEAGRALHYADMFPEMQHGELVPPFTPERYWEAIKAADDAGFRVVVIDSFSHEYAGDGGILDLHDQELTRMAGDDWKKREAMTFSAWVKPKSSHKRLVSHLLQVRAHLVIAMRAEERIEIIKENGKTVVRPKQSLTGADGWIPVAEKSFAYEMTLSLLLTADRPGYPKPIKLQEQHRALVPLDQPLSEDTGDALAKWAAGGAGRSEAETLVSELVGVLAQIGADASVVDGHRENVAWLKRNLTRAQERLVAKGSAGEPDGPDRAITGGAAGSPLAEPDEPVDTPGSNGVPSPADDGEPVDRVLIPVFGTGGSKKIGTPLDEASDEWVTWALDKARATPGYFPDKFVAILEERAGVPA